MPTLGQLVRWEREARGLSLRGLARRARVSPSYVTRLEQGRTGAHVRTLRRLAVALDINLPRLLWPAIRRRLRGFHEPLARLGLQVRLEWLPGKGGPRPPGRTPQSLSAPGGHDQPSAAQGGVP